MAAKRGAIKSEASFQTWQEAVQACWKYLGKDELCAHEIINWFHDRKITIRGNNLTPFANRIYAPRFNHVMCVYGSYFSCKMLPRSGCCF